MENIGVKLFPSMVCVKNIKNVISDKEWCNPGPPQDPISQSSVSWTHA
jgi:hypothetical protein